VFADSPGELGISGGSITGPAHVYQPISTVGCHRRPTANPFAIFLGGAEEVETLLEIDLLVRDLGRQENKIVRIEVPANVAVRQESLMRRVAQVLEPIHLHAQQRIDRSQLIGDEDSSARASNACQLRDGQLRASYVVQHAMAAREVEARVVEGKLCYVTLDEADVVGRSDTAGLEVVGSCVDTHDLEDVRSKSEGERSGTTAGVESCLRPGEGTQ
jgi:hypothetical protein